MDVTANKLMLSRQVLSPDMTSVMAEAPTAVEHVPGKHATCMCEAHIRQVCCSLQALHDDCNVAQGSSTC